MKPIALGSVLMACLGGCAGITQTQFHILDHRGSTTKRYYQPFDECYYSRDPAGHVDVIARRRAVDAEGRVMTQVVHVSVFWNAEPGRTFAEASMINATLSYFIVSGPTGASFEGSGFVTFRENRRRDQLTGRVEMGSMSPVRRLGSAQKLFDQARIDGEIVAIRDKIKVVSILNDMRRTFGPIPEYKPPEDVTDVP